MQSPTSRGFTLVELMVVVTIIVLLLALLIPAMDKAIYQATLATCGAKQKAVLTGVVSYAMDSKKWYPSHGLEGLGRQGEDPNAPRVFIGPMTIYDSHDAQINYDMRPSLKGYVVVNTMLQCPFNEQMDMEIRPADGVLEVSYMLMWGWFYKLDSGIGKGMFKMGDTWGPTPSFAAPRGLRTSYNVMIGDMDMIYPSAYGVGDGALVSSHPDMDRRMMNHAVTEGGAAFGTFWWASRWVVSQHVRGTLDLNFGYDDGSVRRVSGVPSWQTADDQTPVDRVPLQYDARRYGFTDRFSVLP